MWIQFACCRSCKRLTNANDHFQQVNTTEKMVFHMRNTCRERDLSKCQIKCNNLKVSQCLHEFNKRAQKNRHTQSYEQSLLFDAMKRKNKHTKWIYMSGKKAALINGSREEKKEPTTSFKYEPRDCKQHDQRNTYQRWLLAVVRCPVTYFLLYLLSFAQLNLIMSSPFCRLHTAFKNSKQSAKDREKKLRPIKRLLSE